MLSACSEERSTITKMDQIKAIGDTNPQLALRMQDSLETTIRTANKYVQMKYDLLETRLRDKAYIVATSDKRIMDVVAYFEEEGTDAEKQEAYYYAGSVYRDLQDTPKGLLYFFKSMETAENGDDCDSVMLINTYSGISRLQYKVQDYKNALVMARKEYKLSEKRNDVWLATVIQVGACLVRLDSLDEAKVFLRKSIKMALEQKDNDMGDLVALLHNLSHLKMTEEAGQCYSMIRNDIRNEDVTSDLCLAVGRYYEAVNIPDSALHYYKQAYKKSNSLEETYDATKKLLSLYINKGDNVNVGKYAEEFIKTSGQLDFAERQELSATVNNQFQYHRDYEEERMLKESESLYRAIGIGLTVLSIVIFFVFLFLFLYRRKKQMEESRQYKEEIRKANEAGDRLKKEIQSKNEELKDVLAKVKQRSKEIEQIQSSLDDAIVSLHEKESLLNETISKNERIRQTLNKMNFESNAESMLSNIKTVIKKYWVMTDKDWEKLHRAINGLYPSFEADLTAKFKGISDKSKKICYMARAGFTDTEIERLTGLPSTTVWRWAKKVRGADWDESNKEAHP